jgi:hypothetical protein
MLSSKAESRQVIIFHVLPSLPYPSRMLLSALFFFSGLMLQSFGWVWPGVIAVFAGAALLTVQGYENTVRLRKGKQEWRPVRPEEMQRIIEINKKQRSWDVDAIDISNKMGFFTLVGLVLLLGGLSRYYGGLGTTLGRVIAYDSAAALLPFWLTGIRSLLKNDVLVIKTSMLLQMSGKFSAKASADEKFLFQMQTAPADKGGEVPQDVKAMVRFEKGPEGLMGLQIQIAINSVKGTDYPYAYCVLVAKPGFGLSDRLSRLNVCPGATVKTAGVEIIVESEVNDEAEVMVFRQETGGGGYHTNAKQAQSIFDFTLAAARKLSQST